MKLTDPEAVELDLKVWARQRVRQHARDRRRRALKIWLTPVCALVVFFIVKWMLTK